MHLFGLMLKLQCAYHVSQRGQALVDVFGLFDSLEGLLSFAEPLAAGKVHKGKLGDDSAAVFKQTGIELDLEDGVAPRTLLVLHRRKHLPSLETEQKE